LRHRTPKQEFATKMTFAANSLDSVKIIRHSLLSGGRYSFLFPDEPNNLEFPDRTLNN
jgi:hypothetical protein